MSETRSGPFGDPARRAVLQRYGLAPDALLGHGGEAHVFALDPERVLRLYRGTAAGEVAAYIRRIGALYDTLDRGAVPFALPHVLEVHAEEVAWSIERRLPGRTLDGLLDALRGDERTQAITGYVDGAADFGYLGVPTGFGDGYGALFTEELLRTDSWGDLLEARLRLQLQRGTPVLRDRVAHLDAAALAILESARREPSGARTLVHGDFFPGNVLFGDDLRVSAVLDLGWLTVVGDVTHDVRSAVAFWEVRPWSQPGDAAALVAAARRHLGPDAADLIDRTRRFEQLRFAFVAEDEHLFAWCIEGLRSAAPPAAGTVPGDGS